MRATTVATLPSPRFSDTTCACAKSTFIKICLLFYPSYTLPSSAERRAGEDRANNGTTPRQQKVLFVNICHRHWLFCPRGFPREFPSGHSGTSGTAVPLPLGCPALREPR